jgi:hypothetical protein
VINPPRGATGHHEVSLDTVNRKCWVASRERIELNAPHSIDILITGLQRAAQHKMSIDEFAAAINRIKIAAEPDGAQFGEGAEAVENMRGQALLLQAGEPTLT